MLTKTVRVYQRRVGTWRHDGLARVRHVERVRRETWWLFGLVLLYSREEITGTNL